MRLCICILGIVAVAASVPPQDKTGTAESYLELEGAVLGEVTQHDAMMLSYHVPMFVDRLKQSGGAIPEAVNALLGAASRPTVQ